MSILHKLAEASRRGKIVMRDGDDSPLFVSCGTDWDIPSFDFGQFFHHSDDVPSPFNDAMREAILSRAWELQDQSFSLPFPRCAFLFNDCHGNISAEVLNQSDGIITHTGFSRSRNGEGYWLVDPYEFRFDRRMQPISYDLHHISSNALRRQIFELGGTIEMMAREQANEIMLALAMLSMPSIKREVTPSDYAASVNRGRAKGKLAPIPDTVTIRVDQPVSENVREDGGLGIARCPHDRRAHMRRLRSGKIIPVKAAAIRGGGDSARHYRVIT